MIRIVVFFILYAVSMFAAPLPLRVGMELSYPPFEMICTDGKPCGVTVDLVEALGQFLGQEVKIENIPFIGLIPSLQNGMIDLIASSLTITEQRKKKIDFSDPYVTTGLALLLNIRSDIQDIGQVDEPGRIAVVKSGTSGEIYALNNIKKGTVRVLDKEAMCVLEVIQGKADAFIYDQLSVYTNWKKNPNTTKAVLAPFQKEFWAFGIRKNNPELLAKINAFLSEFRQKGGFDQLAIKYLPEQKEAFKKMGIPFVF